MGLGFNPLGGVRAFSVWGLHVLLFSGFLPQSPVKFLTSKCLFLKEFFLYVIILAFQRPRDIIWRIAPPSGHSLFHTVDLDLEVTVQRSEPEIQDCQD